MLENILHLLEKSQKYGKGYRARCPIHKGDNHSALSIREEDGKVIAHCFVCGGNGLDLVKALDLPASALFSEPYQARPRDQKLLTDTELEDKLMISIYEAAKSRQEPIRHSDLLRYRLAIKRNQVRQERLSGRVA